MKSDKRYLVFAYDHYDSLGGLNDLKGSFASLEEVENFIESINHYDCCEVYDRIKGILAKVY